MGGTSTADVLRAVLTLLDWQQQIVHDALRQIERAGGHRAAVSPANRAQHSGKLVNRPGVLAEDTSGDNDTREAAGTPGRQL